MRLLSPATSRRGEDIVTHSSLRTYLCMYVVVIHVIRYMDYGVKA